MQFPNVYVTSERGIVSVAFEPDLPKIVKYHIKCIVFIKFVNKFLVDLQTLKMVELTIRCELQRLVATGQLYWFVDRWHEKLVCNYNRLNFE